MRWQQKLETFIDAQRQEISDALTFSINQFQCPSMDLYKGAEVLLFYCFTPWFAFNLTFT